MSSCVIKPNEHRETCIFIDFYIIFHPTIYIQHTPSVIVLEEPIQHVHLSDCSTLLYSALRVLPNILKVSGRH